jgi:hypothetical protein
MENQENGDPILNVVLRMDIILENLISNKISCVAHGKTLLGRLNKNLDILSIRTWILNLKNV